MRILVAGASGVLGSRIIPALARAGHAVTGTTRSRERFEIIRSVGGEPLVMDAHDRDSVDRAFQAARPAVVVLAFTDLADLDWAANAQLRVAGSRNLVAACHAAGVERMIAESVSWTYRPGTEPAGEGEPFATLPDGAPEYAATEALEREVATLTTGVVLRNGLLYGPGTWYAAEGILSRKAAAGVIEATGDQTSWVHVDDAAAAAVAALDWPGGPVNIVDDDPCDLAEWGRVLASRAGFDGAPTMTASARGRSADNGLARSRGWRPAHPTWRSGLGLG